MGAGHPIEEQLPITVVKFVLQCPGLKRVGGHRHLLPGAG